MMLRWTVLVGALGMEVKSRIQQPMLQRRDPIQDSTHVFRSSELKRVGVDDGDVLLSTRARALENLI